MKPGLELSQDDQLIDPSPAWSLVWIGVAVLLIGGAASAYFLLAGGELAHFMAALVVTLIGAISIIVGVAANVIARRLV